MTSSMSRRRAWWICAEVTSLETIDPTFGKGLLHHSEYYHSRKDPKIKGQSWTKGSSCSAYLLPIWCICTQMAKEQCNILNQGMIFRSRLWHWTAIKKVGEMTHGWNSMSIWRQLVQYHFLKDWLLFRHGDTLAFQKCEEKLQALVQRHVTAFNSDHHSYVWEINSDSTLPKKCFFSFGAGAVFRSRRRLSARQSNLQTLWIECAWDKIPIKRLRMYKSTNHIPIFPYSSSFENSKKQLDSKQNIDDPSHQKRGFHKHV